MLKGSKRAYTNYISLVWPIWFEWNVTSFISVQSRKQTVMLTHSHEESYNFCTKQSMSSALIHQSLSIPSWLMDCTDKFTIDKFIIKWIMNCKMPCADHNYINISVKTSSTTIIWSMRSLGIHGMIWVHHVCLDPQKEKTQRHLTVKFQFRLTALFVVGRQEVSGRKCHVS